MAAYAALVSLMNIVEQIQMMTNHPRRLSTSFDNKQIQCLQENVGFLLDFLEGHNYSRGSSSSKLEGDEVLEREIASAAYAAEDAIESHLVDQILVTSTEKKRRCLPRLHKLIESSISLLEKWILSKKDEVSIQKVVGDLDSIIEKVMKMVKDQERRSEEEQQSTLSNPVASSRRRTTEKTTMVGFDDYLIQLMDMLTGRGSSRLIVPITRMGGIGKTTLARNTYENPLIVQYFDIRAWVTISQQYNVSEILTALLSCLKLPSTGTYGETGDLGEKLYKSLCGRRYVVILDDIWSVEVWDKIKFFFPDNNNGSRIVLTTRLSNVAIHFGSSALKVDFLDENSSWKLFCEKACLEESCPIELEEIGKEIVKNCRGLPLSIAAIGGLLAKSSRTREYWKCVAKDLNSILKLTVA